MNSHSTERLTTPRGTSLFLAVSLVGLLTSACAGDDPITGSWVQPNATTALPGALGGGTLEIDATLVFDGRVSPATFSLDMNLAALGLIDRITAEGTYADDGSDLTLTFTGFVIHAASANTASVADDGSQCIVLQGFAGTPVCFGTPQTNAYTAGAETLAITLNHQVAGSPSQTSLALTPSP